MTPAIIAAVVHVLQLFVEWRRGSISVERPRLPRRLTSVRDLDRHSSTVWDTANLIEVVGLVLAIVGVGRFNVENSISG